MLIGELMSGAGMAGVTFYASNKDDPYITLQDPVSQKIKNLLLIIKHFLLPE